MPPAPPKWRPWWWLSWCLSFFIVRDSDGDSSGANDGDYNNVIIMWWWYWHGWSQWRCLPSLTGVIHQTAPAFRCTALMGQPFQDQLSWEDTTWRVFRSTSMWRLSFLISSSSTSLATSVCASWSLDLALKSSTRWRQPSHVGTQTAKACN